MHCKLYVYNGNSLKQVVTAAGAIELKAHNNYGNGNGTADENKPATGNLTV